MTTNVPFVVLAIFSFILSFGVFDPIFGLNPVIGLVDIVAFLLVTTSIVCNFELLVKSFDRNILYLLLLLLSLFFASVLYGYSGHSRSVFNFKLLIMILLYISMTIQFIRDPKNIQYCLLSFSIGVLVFIILLNTIFSYGAEFNKGRLWIFGENPNSTSARFSLAAIYFLYISLYDPFRSKLSRYLALLAALPIVYVVFQSGSRGSALSLTASLVALFYFSHLKIKYKILFSIIFLAISPYVYNTLVNASSLLERLDVLVEQGGLGAREEIWLPAIDIFLSNPIFGVGEPGYFHEMIERIGSPKDTHNLFLYILASGGLLSFSLFSMFYKKLLLNSYTAMRYVDILPMALLVNITLIALKTGGALTYSMMWFVFAIIASYPIDRSMFLNEIKPKKPLNLN